MAQLITRFNGLKIGQLKPEPRPREGVEMMAANFLLEVISCECEAR